MIHNPEQTPSLEERIITAPNAISALGGILTWEGSKQLHTGRGMAAVVAGRVADVLDGPVARATGQASDFGATVDASIDKLVTTKLLWEMWRNNSAPKPALGVIALSNALNFAATAVAKLRGHDALRPTKSGKLAMAAETATLLAHAGAHAAEHADRLKAAAILRRLGNVSLLAALPLMCHATSQYIRRAATRPTNSST